MTPQLRDPRFAELDRLIAEMPDEEPETPVERRIRQYHTTAKVATAAKRKRILHPHIAPGVIGKWQMVRAAYQLRRCFICGRRGVCEHREPEVELAFLESRRRRTEARA